MRSISDVRRGRPAQRYLAGGIAAVAVYFLLPSGGDAQALLYVAIALSGAAALALGARMHLPRSRRLPWHLLSAGVLLFALGDAVNTAYNLAGRTAPTPAPSDLLYLAGYPFLFLGVWKLVQRLGRVQSRLAALDAAILTVAFATTQWVFVTARFSSEGHSASELAVLFAYPAMDLLLVAPLTRSMITPSWRNRAYRLLVVAIALNLAGDELNALHPASYVAGSWLDAFWLLSYVAWGVAALSPSMARLTVSELEVEPHLVWPRIVMLAVGLLAAPVILVIQTARGVHVDAYVIAVGGAVASLLVLARGALLVRAMDDLARGEREARYFAEAAHVQLAEQNARLQELDSLKDEFVGLVSHELRTPLTSISGYRELLEDPETGPLNEEQREFLGIIGRNARRLLTLVNDLLFVARMDAGHLDLKLGTVDLAEIVSQAIDSAQPRATDRGVSLLVDADGPTVVTGDADRLAQLLDNLVSNAVKFTPRDGRAETRVRRRDGRALIEIADSGVGIPADELGNLFERFYRTSDAVSQQVPGTGLGLYIAKAIAEAHGGTIAVESEVGSGTTFRVELPLAG